MHHTNKDATPHPKHHGGCSSIKMCLQNMKCMLSFPPKPYAWLGIRFILHSAHAMQNALSISIALFYVAPDDRVSTNDVKTGQWNLDSDEENSLSFELKHILELECVIVFVCATAHVGLAACTALILKAFHLAMQLDARVWTTACLHAGCLPSAPSTLSIYLSIGRPMRRNTRVNYTRCRNRILLYELFVCDIFVFGIICAPARHRELWKSLWTTKAFRRETPVVVVVVVVTTSDTNLEANFRCELFRSR